MSTRYVSLPRASRRTGLSVQSLRSLILDGELDAYHLGRRIVRLDASDVDRLASSLQSS